MRIRSTVVIAALAASCWAGAGRAQEYSGPYVGVSVGDFNFEQKDIGVIPGLPGGVPLSDSGGAYRLFGGYQLNRYYSIEAGYAKTNDFTESYGPVPFGGDIVSEDVQARYGISTLRIVAMAPFSSVNMFGSLGYYNAKLKIDGQYFQNGAVALTGTYKHNDGGLTVAGGVQFDLARFSIRGEYEWFDTKNATRASSFNVGVLFVFE